MINCLHNWAQKWAKERPRQYVMIWVTFWNFLSVSNTPLAYGWNIWVDDLFKIFYGDVEYTMSRGGPVFAFALIIFFAGWASTFMSLMRLQDPNAKLNVFRWFTLHGGGSHRTWYSIGLVGGTVSAVLMGVAVQYTLLWLLCIGCAFFGISLACMQPITRYVAILSFHSVGQKGVGIGLKGAMPGIWAASFAYWGLALSDSLSIQTAIYIAAGVSAALALVVIPFTEVSVPQLSKYRKHSQERLTSHGTPLSIQQIIRTPQIWLMWVAFLFMMTPGFGIKYLISPMIANVYGASSSTQSLASFLFLMLYAVARFVGGALDYLVDPMIIFRVLTLLAVPVFIVQGWLATQYDSKAALYGFITCQCLVGMVLGASKVLISLLCFNIFKAVNFVRCFSLLWSTFGTAALLGPILGWWSLSGHGLSTDANYKSELGHAVSIFCYISAGAQAVCFVLASMFIKNLDFSKYAAHHADADKDSIMEAAPILGKFDSKLEVRASTNLTRVP